MKALSIMQPWAGLVAAGRKTIELRSWSTSHRGALAVCSGLRYDPRGVRHGLAEAPRGVVLCVVDIVEVRPATINDASAACVSVGLMEELLRGHLFAWLLSGPRACQPNKVRGSLGLFTLPQGVLHVARSQNDADHLDGHAEIQRKLF